MTNQEFLNTVVSGMNHGYYISRRGKDKLIPLHGMVGNLVKDELGDGFAYYGYGDNNGDKEHNIKNHELGYNADCTFEKFDESGNIAKSNGGIIECKTFFSSGKKNIANNVVSPCNSIASKVRPLGYRFGFFFMTQNTIPLFTQSGEINGIEVVGKNTADAMKALSTIAINENNASDLLSLCVYDLPDFDYNLIHNQKDYASALMSYEGQIRFTDIQGINSTERFIFNDPTRFAAEFAKIVKSPKKIVLTEEYAKLFSSLPIEEQEEYLIGRGLLPKIPFYIK